MAKIKFLIQIDEKRIPVLNGLLLLESLRYQSWLGNHDYDYLLAAKVPAQGRADYVPVGDLDFIKTYFETYLQQPLPKPLGIPPELWQPEFLKRDCALLSANELRQLQQIKFVKSAEIVKAPTYITNHFEEVPEGRYLVSNVLDIDSEWRALVFHKRLVWLGNYAGDFTKFPDVQLIEKMVASFQNCPAAYTLDVGRNEKDGTFLIETSDFYACGLYGFENLELLPKMLAGWYLEFVRKQKKTPLLDKIEEMFA